MKYGAPGRASGLERGRTTEHGKAGGANALAPQPEHLYVPSAPREQTRGVPQSPNPWDRAPSPWAAQRTGAMANGPDPHKGRMRKEGGLVHHLKSKGVKFDLMSETEAEKYLRENNNLFRLGSHRVVFPKHVGGPNDGKYSNLDFAMLVDLAIIDTRPRDELLPTTLDIGHFRKVRLPDDMEAHRVDGYQVIQDFTSRDDYTDQDGSHRKHVG